MKSIFKILVLGVVPILALTAVVDQGLAADKGSQLIFHSNMYHTNFISVANANEGSAVTVQVQYYNDEMAVVLWYLRVIPGGGNVLVNPFDHMIPGTAEQDDDGEDIPGSETNVSKIIGDLPAMSYTDEDDVKHDGINSGRFLIVVTAVGANMALDVNTDASPAVDDDEKGLTGNHSMVNVLFPTYLVKGMHGMDNIDECGSISIFDPATGHTEHGDDGADDCADGTGFRAIAGADGRGVVQIAKDPTTKNVGDLNVDNAEPVAFNHLTGHFTEALVGSAEGGSDQTASWGGTPIIRPAVNNADNMMMLDDYMTLNGANTAAIDVGIPDADTFDHDGDTDVANATPDIDGDGTYMFGGRLAEKDAMGSEKVILNVVDGYSNFGGNLTPGTDPGPGDDADQNPVQGKISNGSALNRALNGGALVLPALHGGGARTHQVMVLLSAADDFGNPAKGKGGDYMLIPAMTGYNVALQDNMGDRLPDPAAEDSPVFGGTETDDPPSGTKIIVNGIRVMTDANLAKCTGTMIAGAWTVADLTSIVPTASTGAKDFAGLDAMMDPMMNATPGLIKFMRSGLTCKKDYGDGDAATGSTVEDNDGVPTSDARTYSAGTLIAEQANTDRTFVTTGQAVLKFLTADATFAASWSLKSPPSTDDPGRVPDDTVTPEVPGIDLDGDGIVGDVIAGTPEWDGSLTPRRNQSVTPGEEAN